jgi:alpha-beta hydrolase superfamily lysophospholipase
MNTAFALFAQLFHLTFITPTTGLNVQVGEVRPAAQVAIRGDVLYLHGLGDRFENHGPLFKTWTDAGFRVVGFDLPSHGGTYGPANNLDCFSFDELIGIAAQVERSTRESTSRPLIVAGWSTGGLIAVRAAQSDAAFGERAIAGLVLVTPGIAVPAIVGEHGVITERTLTHNPNPPHIGGIKPKSPFLKPVFATRLLANAALARATALPSRLPVLTLLADDVADVYVKTPEVRAWALREKAASPAPRQVFQCEGGRHELDNESENIGLQIRQLIGEFSIALLSGDGDTGSAAAAVLPSAHAGDCHELAAED